MRRDTFNLIKTIACTTNHDNGNHFIQGEDARLRIISKLINTTKYKCIKEGNLFVLYSQVPLNEISDEIVVISSHIDTVDEITKPFCKIKSKNRLLGTFDNSLTNAAILDLMIKEKLPKNVVVAFTGDEEVSSNGAKELITYLKANDIKPRVIVTDVTSEGWNKKRLFTIENYRGKNQWIKRILKTFDNLKLNYKAIEDAAPDESHLYSSMGIDCFSLCIPTKGEMHSDDGIQARISSYNVYMEALKLATLL